MSKTQTRAVPVSRPPDPDVQHIVTRRLALRLGLSLPVAATIATFAGIGPKEVRS